MTLSFAGWGYRCETQLAGLGPDANLLRFARQHCAGKVAFPVSAGGGASLALTAEAGLLLPWGARSWATPTSISDRFFLGGLAAGALRGFAHKGVGPSDPRRPVGEVRGAGWECGCAGGCLLQDALDALFAGLCRHLAAVRHPRDQPSGGTPWAATSCVRSWRR